LINNWKNEFQKWLGSHRCKPLVLSASMKAAEQHEMVHDFIHSPITNVMIVGYEMLRKHVKELRALPSPLLICDEGHRLKSTVVNQTIKALLAIPTKKRVMLTGTPVQNESVDRIIEHINERSTS
jgi:SNF2 family DNA or RNA helicase